MNHQVTVDSLDSFILKVAAESKNTEVFNEAVPEENPGQETGQQPAPAKEDPEAIPTEEEMPQSDPVTDAMHYGALAAQAFLSEELMQAALSGHPEAIKIVAATAGEIAAKVSKGMLEGGSVPAAPAEAAPAPVEQAPVEAAPEAPVAPAAPAAPGKDGAAEEQIAAQIAPAVSNEGTADDISASGLDPKKQYTAAEVIQFAKSYANKG